MNNQNPVIIPPPNAGEQVQQQQNPLVSDHYVKLHNFCKIDDP